MRKVRQKGGPGPLRPGGIFSLGDAAVFSLLVVLTGLSTLLLAPKKEVAQRCVISWAEGRMVIELPRDTTLTLTGPVGRTTVVIYKHQVRIAQSDCPNRLCVRSGTKERAGSVIVCAPNRVVVQLVGKGGLDAITR
ncbi:MAG: NusG domain II-containing protein [candidate division WOR-3 bacterium]